MSTVLDNIQEQCGGIIPQGDISALQMSTIPDHLLEHRAKLCALIIAGAADVDQYSEGVNDRRVVANLFNAKFGCSAYDIKAAFEDCPDVREKLSKLTELNGSVLMMVAASDDVPYIVSRYAQAIIEGDVKDLNSILDQGLGKPIERKVTITGTTSMLDSLTIDELKALAGSSVLEAQNVEVN